MRKTFFRLGVVGMFLCLAFMGSEIAIAKESKQEDSDLKQAPDSTTKKLLGRWKPIHGIFNNKPLPKKYLGPCIFIGYRPARYEQRIVALCFGMGLRNVRDADILQDKKTGQTIVKLHPWAVGDTSQKILYKIEGKRLTVTWKSNKNPCPKDFKSRPGDKKQIVVYEKIENLWQDPPGKLPKSFTNSIGMKFTLIPAGKFQTERGKLAKGGVKPLRQKQSEKNPENRRIGADDKNNKSECVKTMRPYYIGTYEVTQEQWKKVMGTTPWKGHIFVKEGKDYAVSWVSHREAVKFCEKLQALDGYFYHLPTEFEWEYACRAGSKTPYSYGTDASKIDAYAWCGEAMQTERYAHKVGQKKPNAWGLYDVHGNVWEWCYYSSDWRPSSCPVSPSEWNKQDRRVACRGGGWNNTPLECQSSAREKKSSSVRGCHIGFRVVLAPLLPAPEEGDNDDAMKSKANKDSEGD